MKYKLKVTGHSIFFVGFPPSVQDIFWFITWTFKRPSLKVDSICQYENIPKIFQKSATKKGQIDEQEAATGGGRWHERNAKSDKVMNLKSK